MRKSVITIKSLIFTWDGVDTYTSYSEEMLIPQIIGKINEFIHTTKSILKTLPLGHRYRGDVELL